MINIKRVFVWAGRLIGVTILIVIILLSLAVTGTPKIKVNYVERLNAISKPADYNESDNVRSLLINAAGDFNSAPDILAGSFKKWPAELEPNEFVELGSWLERKQASIDLLDEAANKPYYWCEYDTNSCSLANLRIDDLKDFRIGCYVLCSRAKLEALGGNFDAMTKHIANIYRLSQLCSHGETLVHIMVGLAMQGLGNNTTVLCLASADLPDEQLCSLAHLYGSNLVELEMTIHGAEKLYAADSMQRLFTDDGNGNGRLIPGKLLELGCRDIMGVEEGVDSWPKAIWVSMWHPDRKSTGEAIKNTYELLEELFKKSPASLRENDSNYLQELYGKTLGYRLLEIGTPAFGQLCNLAAKHRTYRNGMQIIIAAKIFEAGRGKPAEKVEELVEAGLLKAVPMDEYSGKSLIYKRLGDDFIVYGVGEDFVDDGGNDGKKDTIFWPAEKSSFLN